MDGWSIRALTLMTAATFAATATTTARAGVVIDVTYGQLEVEVPDDEGDAEDDGIEKTTDIGAHFLYAFDKSRMFSFGLFAMQREFELEGLLEAFGNFEFKGLVYGPQARIALDLKRVFPYLRASYVLGTYEFSGKTDFLGETTEMTTEYSTSGYDLGLGVDIPLGTAFALMLQYSLAEEKVKAEKSVVKINGVEETSSDVDDAEEDTFKMQGLVVGLGLRF